MRSRLLTAASIFASASCGRVGFELLSGPCSGFTIDPGWTLAPEFRAAVVSVGLARPAGLTFAGGPYGDRLFVANQGDNTLRVVDLATGTPTIVVAAAVWP